MFTGIVVDIGEIVALDELESGVRIGIASNQDPDTIAMGASIACAGICLTVIEKGRLDDGRGRFDVEASVETLARTTMGTWRIGTRINLERSLKLGQELGGHMVTGHVDGVADIVTRDQIGDMSHFRFKVSSDVSRFIAEKGSVALDGTSLTVNEVSGDEFNVMLIPHSLAVTTWQDRQTGDRANVEVDLMARYVARLRDSDN